MIMSETINIKSKEAVNKIYKMIKGYGDYNPIIPIPMIFVEYTGDHYSAILLSQLLFLTPFAKKENDGWIYNTYEYWSDTLKLSKYTVRKSVETLKKLNIIESKIKKVAGITTLHLKINTKFSLIFKQYLEDRKLKIQTSRNENNELREVKNSNFLYIHNTSYNKLHTKKEISKDISSSTIISDDQLAAIRNIFNEYIITAKEINKDPSEIKLVIHGSINIKVRYKNITIKQLIYDKLQIYSAEELIQCIRNYKLICLEPAKYWFKPFYKDIMLLNFKNLNQLLNLDSLKLNSDYYSELRNSMQFLTINEFNSKSPLNTETSTYMGVDTEILKAREISEYYSDIKMYIKSGIFEKNISYFQWLEEIIICLIYRKDDEVLLKELVKLHKYWYRHFKIMVKSDM